MTKINKKGFTLVELLAVIAILAILMLLITPNILNLFTEGKKDSFIIQVQSIYKAAEQKFLTDSISSGTPGPYTFCHTKDNDISPLNLNGTGNVYYSVSVNADGKITDIKATDGAYYFTKTSTTGVQINEIDNPTTGTTSITCE